MAINIFGRTNTSDDDGGITYTDTIIETGALAGSGSYDEEVTFATPVVIDYVKMERTAGTSDFVQECAFYDGDPGDGGSHVASLFGGPFDGATVDPIAYGPNIALGGGSTARMTIPLPAGSYYVKIAEGAGNAGTFTLTIRHRPAESAE